MPKRIATPKTTNHVSEYATQSRLEISQILQALARQAIQVTARVGGDDFFLTSVLAVNEDTDHVLIESGRRNPHKERILAGQQISCATSLDRIKISFRLDSVALVTIDGEEAFQAPLPDELTRLQRREYYRMSPPLLKPIKCSISTTDADTQVTAELNLLDISCGGVALVTPPETFAVELGAIYECIINLPNGDPLKTEVRSRYSTKIVLPNNKNSQRSGFQFVALPEHSRAAIQRYLMHLQLERRATR